MQIVTVIKVWDDEDKAYHPDTQSSKWQKVEETESDMTIEILDDPDE